MGQSKCQPSEDAIGDTTIKESQTRRKGEKAGGRQWRDGVAMVSGEWCVCKRMFVSWHMERQYEVRLSPPPLRSRGGGFDCCSSVDLGAESIFLALLLPLFRNEISLLDSLPFFFFPLLNGFLSA